MFLARSMMSMVPSRQCEKSVPTGSDQKDADDTGTVLRFRPLADGSAPELCNMHAFNNTCHPNRPNPAGIRSAAAQAVDRAVQVQCPHAPVATMRLLGHAEVHDGHDGWGTQGAPDGTDQDFLTNIAGGKAGGPRG